MDRLVSCVCLWLLLGQVRGSHVPAEMNLTIQNLTRHYYKIPSEKRFDGELVFSKDQFTKDKRTKEVNKVLMGGILETYERMMKKMLEQPPTPSPETPVSPRPAVANDAANTRPDSSVRKQLSYILRMVQRLKENYYKEQEELLTRLDSLHDIKTDNIVVQSKALWELPWLYEEASLMVKDDRKRRRRRTKRDIKRAKFVKE